MVRVTDHSSARSHPRRDRTLRLWAESGWRGRPLYGAAVRHCLHPDRPEYGESSFSSMPRVGTAARLVVREGHPRQRSPMCRCLLVPPTAREEYAESVSLCVLRPTSAGLDEWPFLMAEGNDSSW